MKTKNLINKKIKEISILRSDNLVHFVSLEIKSYSNSK